MTKNLKINPKLVESLEWNVYMEDLNKREIIVFNVFNHYSFRTGLIKAWQKYHDDIEAFEKEVNSDAAYYFWSKREYEIGLTSPFGGYDGFKDKKIDIYDQLRLNWDAFMSYIIAELWG